MHGEATTAVLTGTLWFLVMFVVIATCIAIAGWRRYPAQGQHRPHRRLSCTTDMRPADALRQIVRFAISAGYTIDVFDENNLRVVLATSPNFLDYGYFIPIYVSESGYEKTLVEVYIQSRLHRFTVGPTAQRHQQCFNGVRAMLFAEGATCDSFTSESPSGGDTISC